MSAKMQTDPQIHQIIIKSFELLRFRLIFEDYDNNRSEVYEQFDAIMHTNEFQQLQENTYYPQTMDDLQTNYGEIFDDIADRTLNLERNKDENKEIAAIENSVEKLELPKSYLKDRIFNPSLKHISASAKQALSKTNYRDFLQAKNKLKNSIINYRQKIQWS